MVLFKGLHCRALGLVILGSSLTLFAGCGGGDDGTAGTGSVSYSGTEEPVSIEDSTTAKTVAISAVGFDSGSSTSEADSYLSFKSSLHSGPMPGFDRIARDMLALAIRHDGDSAVLAGASRTQSCNGGGSITASANVAAEGAYTTGDTASFTASNCVESQSFEYAGQLHTLTYKLNGSMAMEITAASGDAWTALNSYGASGEWSVTIKAIYSAFTMEIGSDSSSSGLEIGGGHTSTTAGTDSETTSVAMTGNEFVVRDTLDSVTSEFKLDDFDLASSFDDTASEFSRSSDFTLASMALDGSIMVDTTTPFVCTSYGIDYGCDYGSYPAAGEMVITAGSARVKVAIETYGYVEVYEDLDGDGTWEGHTQYPASDFFY